MGRDYIPKLAKFRMPRWFEEAHVERRKTPPAEGIHESRENAEKSQGGGRGCKTLRSKPVLKEYSP